MTADFASINLTHHFLIAMPGLEDAVFANSVVYVCEHSANGAMGLVINKPSDLSMASLFEKVDLPLDRADLLNTPVLQGGPVQTDRGFVLHDAMWGEGAAAQQSTHDAPSSPLTRNPTPESGYVSTLTMQGGLGVTTSKDVLEALSMGMGPRRVLVSLGYAAWEEGQLESELAENSWLTVGADTAVIFDTPVEQRYARAMKLLGLEAWMLSGEVGHA